MLQTSAPIRNLHSEATHSPMMQNYLWKLQVTIKMSTYMRDLRSDATRLSKFFASH